MIWRQIKTQTSFVINLIWRIEIKFIIFEINPDLNWDYQGIMSWLNNFYRKIEIKKIGTIYHISEKKNWIEAWSKKYTFYWNSGTRIWDKDNMSNFPNTPRKISWKIHSFCKYDWYFRWFFTGISYQLNELILYKD